MKKILIFTIIFVIIFSSFSYAVSPNVVNEFIQNYPNDYIYRIVFPEEIIVHFSSPAELEFELIDTVDGRPLLSGKALRINNPSRQPFYYLKINGKVERMTSSYYNFFDTGNWKGYEGNIDIYRWNGSSFFLPIPSTFLRDLVGQILTILPVGFGIASAMLLVLLLVVYFRRYLHRLI